MAQKLKRSPSKIPNFKSEAEEADWWASPAGRRYSSQSFEKKMKQGKVIVSEERTMAKETLDRATHTGSLILYKSGMNVKPTNPAVLQELMDHVKAKQTQAVSLRLPVGDIETAKHIAAQTGIGYQTVLKEMISKGLRGLA